MFEKAARLKLRFSTGKGMVSVEDLWDLPLTSANGASLDDTARTLHNVLKTEEEVSFVNPSEKKNDLLKLQFDIVLHIIKVRQEENAARLAAKEKKAKTQQILALIADKENSELASKSKDELQKMLEEM